MPQMAHRLVSAFSSRSSTEKSEETNSTGGKCCCALVVQAWVVVWLSSLFATLKFVTGAEGETRTPYFLALFLLGFTPSFPNHAFFLRKSSILLFTHLPLLTLLAPI